MKNLQLLLNLKIFNEVFLETTLIICGKISHEADLCSKLKNVFVIAKDSLYSVELSSEKAIKYYDLKNLFPDPDDVPRVISMWYRDLYDTIYLCFENGEIFALILDNNGVQHSRSTSVLDCNVKQILWSPDEEFSIVVSDNNKVMLLNSEFFILAEIDLGDSFLGENELISVGWCKKETQFHGSEGKSAAVSKPTIDSSLGEDTHAVRVTWRGDSNLFAIGYWCFERNLRKVKVYNTEGILQSISEDIPGDNFF